MRFEAQVKRTPDAVAVRAGEAAVSYRALNARANQVARYLSRAGVQPGEVVALALDRSPALLAGMLGVIKAGAAYLPLDVKFPQARLRHVLADSGTRLALASRATHDSLPPHLRSLVIDDPDVDRQIAAESDHDWHADAASRLPARIAYVIYTSGSTGTPKGIAVSHGALSAFIDAILESGYVGPNDRVVALTTIAFDISILELLVPLCCGAEVCIADTDAVKNPTQMARLVQQMAPTAIQATPSHWTELLPALVTALGETRLLVGGEPLSRELARRLHPVAQDVITFYGPTEATVWASSHRIQDGDFALDAPPIVTIGRALPGYALHVVTATGDIAGPGAVGEVCIGGRALAQGYVNRAGLTAEHFVASRYADAGGRVYRTGDFGRMREDGTIEFLGRNDRQVKIRGFRVELGDVEAALLRHEAVREAVVIAQPEQHRLIAYVVPGSSAATGNGGDWRPVWDAIYNVGAASALDFDLSGWTSSFTATPIPEEDMRSWIDQTIARLRALGPARVLDVGCGTGLLLSRLAPFCEHYFGIDFSTAALQRLEQLCEQRPDLARVELRQGVADDLSAVPTASVDLCILNSVVQYFSGVDYLTRALREAVRVTRAGGHIFVGDVRSLPLARAYYAAVELHKAQDDLAVDELKRRVDRAALQEEELLIDPVFFEVFGRAHDLRPRTLLKRGPFLNELTRFRYDVLLRVGEKATSVREPDRRVTWDSDGAWRRGVATVLTRLPDHAVAVRAIPNARVSGAVATVRLLDDHDTAGRTAAEIRETLGRIDGEDPDDLVALATQLGVDVEFRQLDANGNLDAVFNPAWHVGRRLPASDRYDRLVSRVAGSTKTITTTLLEYLRQQLPGYMVPAVVIPLDRLPLTPNGKLDYRSLPEPVFVAARNYAPPRNRAEEHLCRLFEDVLQVGQIGIHDNFFEVGGHSLMAARLAGMVRDVLHVDVSMQALFEAPTVARLAAHLNLHPGVGRASRRIVPLRETGQLPPLFCLPPVYGLSFAYAGLARELDRECPIYCLQASGIDTDEAFAPTLEHAARGYVEAIRSVQPSGPYHLFGWSFGGILAYSVACELQGLDQTVALLMVADAYPRTVHPKFHNWARYLDGINEHLRDALHDAGHDVIDRLLRLTVNHSMMMAAFQPKPYRGNLLVIAARENQELSDLWRPAVDGRVEVRDVECNHLQMMTVEHLPGIAQILKDYAGWLSAARGV